MTASEKFLPRGYRPARQLLPHSARNFGGHKIKCAARFDDFGLPISMSWLHGADASRPVVIRFTLRLQQEDMMRAFGQLTPYVKSLMPDAPAHLMPRVPATAKPKKPRHSNAKAPRRLSTIFVPLRVFANAERQYDLLYILNDERLPSMLLTILTCGFPFWLLLIDVDFRTSRKRVFRPLWPNGRVPLPWNVYDKPPPIYARGAASLATGWFRHNISRRR